MRRPVDLPRGAVGTHREARAGADSVLGAMAVAVRECSQPAPLASIVSGKAPRKANPFVTVPPPPSLSEAATRAAAKGATLRRALLDGAASADASVEEMARVLREDTSDLALKPKDPNVFNALLAASVRARASRFAATTNRSDKSY